MRFRPAALRQLEAPENLDEVVRLASAPAWLMTAALTAIVVVAAAWATVGSVATTVNAPGVLIHADGVSTLDATATGQVIKLWVPANALAVAGSPLYSLQDPNGRIQTVDAPWDAYITSIMVTEGQLVGPGTAVANLERVTGSQDPLEAVVFVSATEAPAIQPGTTVNLTAPAVPTAIFGTLRGTVASVGAFPETEESLQAFLGAINTQAYLAMGSVVRIVIQLTTVPGSSTALKWSRAAPGFQLDSESSVQASFVIAREHPMTWLIGQ